MSPPTTPVPDLVDRVRAFLADRSAVRERRMFGGVSFMVDERMVVSARGDGSLLVRLDPARNAEFLARGARSAEMGVGRDMGPSWLSVPAVALVADTELSFWLDAALAHHAALGRRS